MGRPAVSGFVFKTFHGARKQKELFCLCSVLFFMTRFFGGGKPAWNSPALGTWE